MAKASIIFDLDGTLWDASNQILNSWNKVLRTCPDIDYQLSLHDFQAQIGRSLDDIALTLLKGVSPERALQIKDLCCEQEEKDLLIGGAELYPGLEEVLALLSEKYNLAIVSNCQDGYIESFMESYPIMKRFFCDYECWGRTGREKGDNIALVMQRNHWHRAVYVGDTLGDFTAAKKANIPFIHAAYGFAKVNAPNKIEDIKELPDLLLKILAN